MVKLPVYTEQQLDGWDTTKLRILRENAIRLNANELVQMCDRVLATRAPQRAPRASHSEHSKNSFVGEYHFVCGKDRGVVGAGPGRFWSGSWRVDEAVVVESLKFGAVLALHETKAEPSYRQGRVIDYRRGARDMVDKDNEGIEFLVEETANSLEWQGGGSGEKGYKWEELRRLGSPKE